MLLRNICYGLLLKNREKVMVQLKPLLDSESHTYRALQISTALKVQKTNTHLVTVLT